MRRTIPDEAWLFVVALAVRAVYFALHTASVYFDQPILDSLWIHQWARALADGAAADPGAYFRAPLYAWLVSLVYRVTGPHAAVVAALQHVLGSVAVVLIYRLGHRLLDRRAGILAALLLTFYWMAIYFEGELLIASLALLLGLLFLLQLAALSGARTRRSYHARLLAAGWVLGLAATARPNFLALVPLGLVWVIWGTPAESKAAGVPRRAAALLFLVATLMPIAPVTVRNLVVARDPVLISSQGGLNLYVGNGPHADGRTAMAPGEVGPLAREQIDREYRDNITLAGRRIAEQAAGHALKGSEVSRYWTEQTWEHVAVDPGRAAALMARKVFYFLNGFEISNNKDLAAVQRENIVLPLAFVRLVWVLPLAWLGLFAVAGRVRLLLGGCVAFYGLSIVLFFVNARFRRPVTPAIFVLAAAGMTRVGELAAAIRRRDDRARAGLLPGLSPRGMAALAVCLLGTIAAVTRAANVDECRACPAFALNRAQLLADVERWDEALAAFEEAGRYPAMRLEAAYGRARVLERRGALVQAAEAYAVLLRAHPDFAIAHLAHAGVLARLGRNAEAEAAYGRAVAEAPDSPEILRGWAGYCLQQRRFAEAAEVYRRIVAQQPQDLEAWMNLGFAQASLRRYDEAIAAWEQILRIDPRNQMALGNIERAQAARGSGP